MEPILFKSSRTIAAEREQLRDARKKVIEKAKSDFQNAEKEKEERKKRGYDDWMLPSVLETIDKQSGQKVKSKKSKKEKKKHKKSKKKKKHVSSSSDSDSDDIDDEEMQWVEKGVEKKIEKKIEKKPDEVPVSKPALQRDDWMGLGFDILPTVSRQEIRDSKRKAKDEERKRLEQPGQHSRELNPYWKDGGAGIPEEEKKEKEAALPHISWLRRAYKRCEEQAKETGASMEEVAAERWGSLKKLESMIKKAQKIENEKQGRSTDQNTSGYQQNKPWRQSSSDSRHFENRQQRSKYFSDSSKPYQAKSDYQRMFKRPSDSPPRSDSGTDNSISASEPSRSHSRSDFNYQRTFKRPSDSPPRSDSSEPSCSNSRSDSSYQRMFKRPSDSPPRSDSSEPSRSQSRADSGYQRTFKRPSDSPPRSDSSEPSRSNSRSDSSYQRTFKRPSDSPPCSDSSEPSRSNSRSDSSYQRTFKRPDSPPRSDSSELSRSNSRSDSSYQRTFKRPSDSPPRSDSRSDNSRSDSGRRGNSGFSRDRYGHHSDRESGSYVPAWKKKTALSEERAEELRSAERIKKEDEDKITTKKVSDSSSSSSSSDSEASDKQDEEMEEAPPSPPLILTEDQMNDLSAKILRAELMGDDDLVESLQNKLKSAQKAKAEFSAAAAANVKQESKGQQEVLLTHVDRNGMAWPLFDPEERKPQGRQRKKNIKTHGSAGERIQYFDDDDKHDLKKLVQREKMSSAEDQNSMFARLAGRSVEKTDEDYQIDDVFVSRAAQKDSEAKTFDLQKARAIFEHKKMSSAIGNCKLCFEKVAKHLLISIGQKAYLCLPDGASLTEGHCLIIPIQHITSSTAMDEDVWQEVQSFKKALVRMFLDMDKDTIFMETSMYLNKFPHACIECVPLEKDDGAMAPMYFKKAILESESEWCMNKKLVDMSKKDIRRSIPKGFPFFSVNFGVDGGFAHAIEDEKKFSFYFGKEIIGGLIDADPSTFRRPRKEPFEFQRQKILKFARMWKPYDFTQTD